MAPSSIDLAFSARAFSSPVLSLLISYYLPHSSSFRLFFSFLMTSTVIGGGKIVAGDTFLVSFLCFLGSLRPKSRLPIITSQSKYLTTDIVNYIIAKKCYRVKLIENCFRAARAASVSAAFLLSPEPLPSTLSPALTSTVNLRSWSGPIVSTTW